MKARIAKTSKLNQPKIKLSIGMIVKNEEEYLDNCLAALNELRKAIPCELIIVDTGSDDNTIDIAKKYTDQVYYFAWCNDFAAARNFGLSKATGEWFIYIDADEHFDDLSELIDFFRSGKEKEYNCAGYFVRNYGSRDLQAYNDCRCFRIHRLFPTTKFNGAIHESIDAVYPSYSFQTVVAHHYGYIFDNEEIKKQKRNRNLPLLLEHVEKNPQDIKYRAMLSLQYSSDDEYDKAIEHVNIGMELDKKQNNRAYSVYFTNLLMFNYFYSEQFNLVLTIGEELLICNPPEDVALLDIYGYMALSSKQMKQYPQGYEFYKQYLKLFQKYKSQNLPNSMNFEISVVFDNDSKCNYMKTTFEPYELLYKLKLAVDSNDNSQIKDTIDWAIKNVAIWSELYADVVYYAMKLDMDISYFINTFEFEDLSSYTPVMYEHHADLLDVIYNYFNKADYTGNLKGLYWTICFQETVVLNANKYMDDASFLTYFQSFAKLVARYVHSLYQPAMLEAEMIALLPRAHRFGHYVHLAFEAYEVGDDAAYYQNLKLALNNYNVMQQPIKRLMQLSQEKRKADQDEFSSYADLVKLKLRQLIRAGHLEEAKQVLDSLEKLIPDDSELKDLKQRLKA